MIESSRIARFLTNHHLGLILMPTEQCNFRCTYCYEDFAIGKMSKSTIQPTFPRSPSEFHTFYKLPALAA